MARYLKKGATYDATAPLNADDPLIVEIVNTEGGGAATLQQVLNTGSTITENVTIENPGNEIVIESVEGLDSSTMTITPYTISVEAGSVTIQSGTAPDFSNIVTALGFCEMYAENEGGSYTQLRVTPTSVSIITEAGPRAIVYENEISGSFETVDGKIVTVVNGIITNIEAV